MTDEETKKRMKSLAYVGTALMEIGNDNAGLTDFLVAKEELKNFTNAMALLELDPETKAGMNDLVTYLSKKLDKRITQYNATN